LHSAPAEKNQQSGNGKSYWQTMPSNIAAQSRPTNFAKTYIHTFIIWFHDDFLYFFFKNKLPHLLACQRELLNLRSGSG
jgi:hypothetical protein